MTRTNSVYESYWIDRRHMAYETDEAYEPTDHERVDVAEPEERWEAGHDAH